MDWETIQRLEAEGVRFGCHTATHPPLRALSVEAVVHEILEARATLNAKLTQPLAVIAYPYGDVDLAIEHLAGACGYDFGVTCRGGSALFYDLPLDLPRIDVAGGTTLAALQKLLEAPSR
jgi:peptidoglycan/xylan/chitin deacetylase (PgdA/CDA1 family)